MMLESYSTFKKNIINGIKNKIEDNSIEIITETIDKNNGTNKEIMYLKRKKEKSLIFYMQDLYNDCANGKVSFDSEESIKKIYDIMFNSFKEISEEDEEIKDYKDKIILSVINRDMNRKLLKDIPFRIFNDLAIVYRVITDETENGMQVGLLTNDALNDLGIIESELYDIAYKNTLKILPFQFEKLDNIISNFFNMPESNNDELGMYVMSNSSNIYGANALIFNNELKKISDKIGDFYIIPSSIHEILIVPCEFLEKENISIEYLSTMLRLVNNGDSMDEAEILSYNVYKYNSIDNCIKII